MNKFKLYTLIAATSVCLSSCDDFLTKYPDTAIPQEKAMTTLEDCNEVVLGIYSAFKNSSLYSGALALQDIQADYVYAAVGFNNNYGELYRWNMRPTTTYVDGVYAGLYKIASRSNFFFDYREQVEATLNTESDRAVFKRRLGDAQFARALAYADLIRVFCDAYDPANADQQLGISLYDTYVGKNDRVPRSSLKASYEFVLNDLDQAEENLDREGADTKYFTKGAVWALKSRVYLYMHEYEKSAEYAQKVMDASYYKLADATTQRFVDQETGAKMTAYDVLWRYDEGDEIIWKIAMSTTDKGGSLGTPFLGYNSAAYYPDFIMGQEVLDKYENMDARYPSYFATINTGHGYEATVLKKYLGNPDIDGGVGKYFVNMPKVLRLSEVYLIAAEAYANAGKLDKANLALNTLRAARIKNYGARNYGDLESFMKELRDDRFRELIMEGFRLSDLKRWNLGFERTPQQNVLDGANESKLKVAAGDVEFTWPIPQHELDATGGVVLPNPSNKK
ncbi:MAG: RagB/SusD family nutrient uptake outer membrane protein [Bacteroidales bacterium]